MRLDSVQGLKKDVHAKIIRPLVEQETKRGLGVRAMAASRPRIPRSMALGIAKHGSGNYVLAVRIQHPMLLRSPELDAVAKMASGEVDVQYVGAVRSQQGAPWSRAECRPLRIGCSVGHRLVTAGTLGAFVRRDENGRDLILSNNHVLAFENAAARGDDILQPGRLDQGTVSVARLTEFVKLDFSTSGSNTVDCAVAELNDGISGDRRNLAQLGQLNGVRAGKLEPGDPVRKLGRSSGATTAAVIATELDNIIVSYLNGDARFDGQIEMDGVDSPFSTDGDSGSLVVDSDNNAVGMIFAGSESGGVHGAGRSYAHPIDTVLAALKVTILV
jgi:trypsin-like peptidase